MLLTVNKLNEKVSGVIGNEKYSLEYNEEIHKKLVELETKFDNVETLEEAQAIIAEATQLIKEGAAQDTVKAYGEYLKYDSKEDKFYLYYNNVQSSIPLPKSLATRLVEAMEKEQPTLPYIKAWMWFLRNPHFSPAKAKLFAKYITTTYVDKKQRKELIEEGYTPEKATELATYTDVSITKNGLLSTYKYARVSYKKFNTTTGEQEDRYQVEYDAETGEATVKLPDNPEDYSLEPPIMGNGGDAFLAGDVLGHKIRVGKVHELPSWDMVDCRDGYAGYKGLHLGGQAYIEGYAGHNRLLLNCFVNPMHIGAFTDSGDGAIRVKEYFVHSAQFGIAKSFYNESNYLSRSNDQWKEMLAKVIEDSEAKITKIKSKNAELLAL